MNRTSPVIKVILILMLLVHGWLTAVAYTEYGYVGFFPPFADSNTTQIFSDLVIALTMVNVWVFFDVRKMRLPAYIFGLHMVGSILMGSFAALLYLFFRDKLSPSSH